MKVEALAVAKPLYERMKTLEHALDQLRAKRNTNGAEMWISFIDEDGIRSMSKGWWTMSLDPKDIDAICDLIESQLKRRINDLHAAIEKISDEPGSESGVGK